MGRLFNTSTSTERLGIWAGIIGPILFFAVFTVEGLLKPGYSAMSEPVSYLALGPFGWIQTLNFLVLGVLLIAFAAAAAPRLRRVTSAGPFTTMLLLALLAISGFGYVLAGSFTSAPPGQPQHPMHTVAFSTVFVPFGMACLLTGAQLLRSRNWRAVGLYSVLAGLLLAVAAIGNLSSLFASTAATPISSPESQQGVLALGGLINRVVIALAFAWYLVVAVRLLDLSSEQAGDAV